MRILITRPDPDAGPLAEKLTAQGHEAVVVPMMRIRTRPATLSLDGVQAILFTSANGVRAFAAASDARGLPAWAVGPATAAAARDAGFAVVHQSRGDAERLAEDIVEAADPRAGALLHPAGGVAKKTLGRILHEHGFDYRRVPVYDAEAISALPAELVEDLKAGGIDAAMFFSPRTARIFTHLAESATATAALSAIDAYCLSPAVAEALEAVPWRNVHVAPAPEQSSLLSLLGIPA